MTTTSEIDAHIRRAAVTIVLTAVLGCAAPTAAFAVTPGPNTGSAGASLSYPAGPC
jgi:hypothetical protein